MRSSQPQPVSCSLAGRKGSSKGPSGLALLSMATAVLGSACSTESGGRKTPITGSPVPSSTRPSIPTTTGANSNVKINPPATTGSGALQNGGTNTLPVPSPTANQAVVQASPTVAPDVAPPPTMDAAAGTAGTTSDASATTSQTSTMTTTMAQATAPATDCTAGKTLAGPRYTKDYLRMRSGPSQTDPQIDVVPIHAEVSYYWTSGTYACVVWRGPTTRVGWLSTAYLQTARP